MLIKNFELNRKCPTFVAKSTKPWILAFKGYLDISLPMIDYWTFCYLRHQGYALSLSTVWMLAHRPFERVVQTEPQPAARREMRKVCWHYSSRPDCLATERSSDFPTFITVSKDFMDMVIPTCSSFSHVLLRLLSNGLLTHHRGITISEYLLFRRGWVTTLRKETPRLLALQRYNIYQGYTSRTHSQKQGEDLFERLSVPFLSSIKKLISVLLCR